MSTLALILIAVLLFIWCGIGPTLILLQKPSRYRLAAIPLIGICSAVLFTYFIARFGLAGRPIAAVALIFFGIIGILGWWIGRPSSAEWFSVLPVALFCLAALGITAWPLIRMGYDNYWGAANPDHALYISVIDYLDTHPFGVVPSEYFGTYSVLGAARVKLVNYDNSVILGISYFFSMLSLLTSVPVVLLFGVMTAAVACLIPSSTFVLCELGLNLPRRVSLAAAGLTACSSLVAYTFYLHSLGAMTVIAILPVGVAVALDYFRNPRPRKLTLVALVFVALYYDYFPGFAMLGLATASIALFALFTRKSNARAVLSMGICIIVAVLAISTTQAATIFHRLVREANGGQFSKSNELLVSFALTLTERGLPFFWGLRLPYSPDVALFGDVEGLFHVSLALAAIFFLGLALATRRRLSGIGGEYVCGVSAILGLVLLYALNGTGGYGAFKIAAWIHPLMLVGLAASMMGSWQWLWIRGRRLVSLLPLCVLAAYAATNLASAFSFGMESMGGSGASSNNAPRLQLKDFRQLQKVADTWGSSGVLVALPDAVAQAWLVPFFRHAVAEFVPQVSLAAKDSLPRLHREMPTGKYVLYWADDSQEVSGVHSDSAVWRNDKFELTPLAALHDVLLFGQGWYRKEGVNSSPFEGLRHLRWLRKRGELLILNPSPRPKQVLFGLIAGYGNSSLVRHIDVYLNGTKFDEIVLRARGRVLTRAFTATAPWTQLELAIREDALPLPRRHALWNRWVPRDARRLNIAVTEISLIDADQTGSLVESALDFKPGNRIDGLVNGVFQDGWIGDTADVLLRVPTRPAALEIDGIVPGVPSFSFPYKISLSIDGAPVEGLRIANPGEFHLSMPLRGRDLVEGREVRLRLGPLATFNGSSSGLNSDARTLSVWLKHIAFVGARPDQKVIAASPFRN